MARLLRRIARIDSFSGSTSIASVYLSIASWSLLLLNASFPASLRESMSFTRRRSVLNGQFRQEGGNSDV